MKALWNKGIGAVTQKERLGFSQQDQRVALYECKVAQFDAQRGECGICHQPLDPQYAVWATAKWMNGMSLASWTFGKNMQYNHEALGFDSTFRSPDEIRAEYGGGQGGHHLFHRKCMRRWRGEAPGMPAGGPVWEREFDLAITLGHDQANAYRIAYERIAERAVARMAEARTHLRAQRDVWLDTPPKVDESGKTAKERKRSRKKRVRQPEKESDASIRARFEEACRAEQEAHRGDDEHLAREEQLVLDSFGVKKPGELSDAVRG